LNLMGKLISQVDKLMSCSNHDFSQGHKYTVIEGVTHKIKTKTAESGAASKTKTAES
jgi:hypothetical protein